VAALAVIPVFKNVRRFAGFLIKGSNSAMSFLLWSIYIESAGGCDTDETTVGDLTAEFVTNESRGCQFSSMVEIVIRESKRRYLWSVGEGW
jgi:hypothetical protein